MILFSPLTALLRVLFTILFNGKTLVIGLVALVILVILGIMALYAGILVFAWNALLAPYLGAQQIATVGGAVLFVLGVWFLGKLGGCLLGCWSLILFATGSAAVAVMDMHLDPTHLLVFAIFLYIFGLGSSSSSSHRSSRS